MTRRPKRLARSIMRVGHTQNKYGQLMLKAQEANQIKAYEQGETETIATIACTHNLQIRLCLCVRLKGTICPPTHVTPFNWKKLWVPSFLG
jgi:hypothetical protein